ncbi:hypothetical protein ACFQZ4_14615 [Catellatospora coxensis]
MARRDTDEPEDRGRNRRGGIGDARAFTPRGRTTRDGGSFAGSEPDPQAEAELQRRRAELRMVRGGRAEEGRPPQRLGRVTGAPSARRPRRADDADGGDFDVEEAPRRRTAAAGRGRPAVRADREFIGRTQAARAREPRRGDRLPAGRGRPQDRRQRPVAPPPDPPKMGEPRRRLRLATAVALLLFAAIGVRLVQFQLADAPAFAAQGLEDRLDKIVLPAARGAIYDRTGEVLAKSVEARFVAVDPELVKDPGRRPSCSRRCWARPLRAGAAAAER